MADTLRSIPITETSTLLWSHPPSLHASVFCLTDTFRLCFSLNITQGLPVFYIKACIRVMPP